jgi:hypothetical protein
MHKTMFAAAAIVIGVAVFALWAGPDPAADRAAIEKAVLEANTAMAEAEKALDAERFFSYIPDFDKA